MVLVAKSSGGSPGDKHVRAGACPGTISARKVLFYKGPRCASSKPVAKRSANARTSEAAQRHENASTSAALGEGLAAGTDVDRFAQVKSCAAGPSAAAEGATRAGGARRRERAR